MKLSQDYIAEKLKVNQRFVSEALGATGAPEMAKFKSETSFLTRLAKFMRRKRIGSPSLPDNAKKPKSAAVVVEDEPVTQEPTGERRDYETFKDTLATLRALVTTLGTRAKADTGKDHTLLVQLVKLQQELRQSEQQWAKMQQEYALVLEREAVEEAIVHITMAYRSSIDAILCALCEPTNLLAWCEDFEWDTAERAVICDQLRRRLYDFVTPRVNEIADSLEAATGAGAPEYQKAQCAESLALFLEKIAGQIRGTANG